MQSGNEEQHCSSRSARWRTRRLFCLVPGYLWVLSENHWLANTLAYSVYFVK